MRETNIFKVLADSQRRAILMMLRNERLNAGEIAEKLQITPAALSIMNNGGRTIYAKSRIYDK